MIDVNSFIKRHPAISWSTLVFSAIMAIIGALTTGITLFDQINSKLKHKTMIAVVINGQFGLEKYDIIGISFRNPTSETQTVGDVALNCITRDGHHISVYAANNTPKEWNIVHGIELTPLTINAGESRNVEFVVWKSGQFQVARDCASVQPVWNDADYQMEFGDIYAMDPNMAGFGNLVRNRTDLPPPAGN